MTELTATQETEQSPAVSNVELALKEITKERLEGAGKNLISKFLEDYATTLPDAIILPDTSARPLFYLLRPVLESVATKRGCVCQCPELIFLLLH